MRGILHGVSYDSSPGLTSSQRLAEYAKVLDFVMSGPDRTKRFSDEVLDSLAEKEKPNLQMGLLRKILNDHIRTVQRKNFVQGRKFSEMLDEAVNRYRNRSLSTAETIAEVV
ncbi:type I site-specific restriction-modification system R (restriction) subunit [Microbacterium halimionae]|uniref:Type I site-specific restriction-modification system R (Restriction) subunit n=1 Tax=Microbacterium halimionae TaxID=1526413 RepID=A0A7W3JQD1_9MICO|nr:type I site-specific restriction-modification system R (restriction) subunit [Microbacterium halimionae]NII94385.1 type I site-specific restriction-modification system R (restriction) subunit [Microbacterium halimionae]